MALNRNSHAVNDAAAQAAEQAATAIRLLAAKLGWPEDEPMLAVLQENAVLGMRVDQWITLLMELTTMLRQQQQVLLEMSQNSVRLANALSSSEQESQQLKTIIVQLASSLNDLKAATGKGGQGLNQNALQTLVPMLDKLKAQLGTIETAIELSDHSNPAGNDRARWVDCLMGAQAVMAVAMLVGGYWVFNRLNDQQFVTWQQSNWALTKLERVEKALGIQTQK